MLEKDTYEKKPFTILKLDWYRKSNYQLSDLRF